MSNNTVARDTIVFFGATGGCGLAALTLALRAGYPCRALCRTPSKLTALLTAPPRSLSDDTLARLTITEGSAKDEAAVRAALTPGAAGRVGVVVSSVGGQPVWWPNPLRPTLDDPTICAGSMTVLLAALGSLNQSPPPTVLALSSTGLPIATKRDVPWAFLPLYRIMLAHPHADKEHMEQVLAAAAASPVVAAYVIVRAAMLTDGPRLGAEAVRVGTEDSPAVGYTVSREDVGGWVFDQVVDNPKRVEEWGGKRVSITY
ncbi:MAG: hypothetical protein M1839_009013 [Geoglossum umbratile]|nr:MAG: hypothetical protein M1839_009013 [Geoglossum umbratile]